MPPPAHKPGCGARTHTKMGPILKRLLVAMTTRYLRYEQLSIGRRCVRGLTARQLVQHGADIPSECRQPATEFARPIGCAHTRPRCCRRRRHRRSHSHGHRVRRRRRLVLESPHGCHPRSSTGRRRHGAWSAERRVRCHARERTKCNGERDDRPRRRLGGDAATGDLHTQRRRPRTCKRPAAVPGRFQRRAGGGSHLLRDHLLPAVVTY